MKKKTVHLHNQIMYADATACLCLSFNIRRTKNKDKLLYGN